MKNKSRNLGEKRENRGKSGWNSALGDAQQPYKSWTRDTLLGKRENREKNYEKTRTSVSMQPIKARSDGSFFFYSFFFSFFFFFFLFIKVESAVGLHYGFFTYRLMR